MSKATELMQAVWDGCNTSGGKSWDIVNRAMREAFRHAVIYRYKFDLGNIGEIANMGNRGRWLWDDWHYDIYRHAVIHENPSAIAAMEDYLGIKKPFIGRDIRAQKRWAHMSTIRRARGRIAPGLAFRYGGTMWDCNSFGPEYDYINATCDGVRLKITHEMLKADAKSEKEKSA